MKPVSLSIAAAIIVILSGLPVHTAPPPQETLQDKVAKLEAQMTQKLDKAYTYYTELTDQFRRMERRVAALESENQLLRIDVKKLTERLDAAGAAGPRGVPGPGPDLAEVGMKIDQALAKLKTTGNVDEATRELVPVARYAVTKLAEALGQVGSPDYVASVEMVLARCPTDELRGPLEAAVKDRARRTSVARVIGSVADPALSKMLEPFTGDSDPIAQVALGQALLDCKNKMGVPPLLKALEAPESEIRFLAVRSLKRVNKGETYGFDMNKKADENAAAIKAWNDWWQKEGPKLFE